MKTHTLILTTAFLITGNLIGQAPAIDVTPTTLSADLFTGGPDISVGIDTLDFGQGFVGYTDSLELVVANNGNADLLITSAAAEPAEYTISPSLAGIDMGGTETFLVTFSPTTLVDYPGTLTFISNDPDEDTLVIALQGQGVLPPVISVSPDSLSEALFTGGTSTQTLTIENTTGGSDLVWELELENVGLDTVTSTKADYADWTLPENQDRITNNVWITRANIQGIFNAATESSYNRNSSPHDTEWAYGLTENLLPTDYQVWREAIGGNPPGMVGQSISLHLISDDLYFDVMFHSWTAGGNGGGFSYTRTEAAPRWLAVSQESGVVSADSSQTIEVTFDAAGLFGGDYQADIVVTGNDPITPESRTPVHLNVTGAADITVSADTIDFGQIFVNYADSVELLVENKGTEDLLITSVVADPAEYTVTPALAGLDPDDSQVFLVKFAPLAVNDYPGTLTLTTTDPDEGTYLITLLGEGVEPPIVGVTPDSLSADLMTNDTVQQVLTILNTGASDLVYEISAQSVSSGEPDAPSPRLAKAVSTGTANGITGGSLKDLLGDLQQISQRQGVQNRPVSKVEATSQTIAGNPVWHLLHTDPDEPHPSLDIHNVYGAITLDEVLFKVDVYEPLAEANYYSMSFLIDADQDTSTGLDIDDLVAINLIGYGWQLGVDYFITFLAGPGGSYGRLLRVVSTPYGWDFEELDSLMTRVLDLEANEIILGVNAQHFEDYSALNFAIEASLPMIAYSEDYIPDQGAGHITFALSPPWLRFSSNRGVIPAGSQEELAVTFDAEGLFGGDYQANIVVASNDPASPERIVPAHLAVTGVPHIAIEADFVDFGTAFIGYLDSAYLKIDNVGTDVLEITDVVSSSEQLTAIPTSLAIPPLSSDTLNLYLLAASEGIFSSTITLITNDPDSAEVSLPVYSVVAIAPDISLTPNEVLLTARPDSVATAQLTLANSGGSELTYAISVVYADNGLAKAQGTLDQGGPDAFGYRWKDSNEPGGPAFEWIDASDGTPIILSDDNYVTGIPLGFDFSYYGATFSQINVMSNGWLSFMGSDWGQPWVVPDSAGYYPGAIAPFAGDLYPPEGQVRYKTIGTAPNRVFVVEYNQVPWCCSGPPYMTFEVVFYESGDKLRFQYLDLQGQTPSAIGIASPDNSTGLGNGGSGITYIDPGIVGDNYALEFSVRTEWLTLEPSAGSVAAGDSVNIAITTDISELELGSYSAQILVSSNDPDEGQVAVPVSLSVILAVEAEQALPQSFALHQNYPNPFNPIATIRYDLPEASQVKLIVYDILGREVVRLVDGYLEPGYHSITWHAKDKAGRESPSGLYIARMVTPEYSKSIKMLLLK